jgi:membrane peptidoglycan carboxypeptidase
MKVDSKTAPTHLATENVNEEINRIKEMMGIVLNEQTTIPTEQPEKTPTEKLQELLNTKFSAGLDPDGKMGPKTAQAIINALGKATVTTPTPSSTNQTSTDTKPTDNTSPESKLGDNKETIPTI